MLGMRMEKAREADRVVNGARNWSKVYVNIDYDRRIVEVSKDDELLATMGLDSTVIEWKVPVGKATSMRMP